MKDGTKNKTRKGDRQIVSVSLPIPVFEQLETICDHYSCNRSDLVAKAIASYVREFGLKVGEA